jgi:hypothetical protein
MRMLITAIIDLFQRVLFDSDYLFFHHIFQVKHIIHVLYNSLAVPHLHVLHLDPISRQAPNLASVRIMFIDLAHRMYSFVNSRNLNLIISELWPNQRPLLCICFTRFIRCGIERVKSVSAALDDVSHSRCFSLLRTLTIDTALVQKTCFS